MELESDPKPEDVREKWRKEMRKAFCKKDMIDEEGNLVKEYDIVMNNNKLDTFI